MYKLKWIEIVLIYVNQKSEIAFQGEENDVKMPNYGVKIFIIYIPSKQNNGNFFEISILV